MRAFCLWYTFTVWAANKWHREWHMQRSWGKKKTTRTGEQQARNSTPQGWAPRQPHKNRGASKKIKKTENEGGWSTSWMKSVPGASGSATASWKKMGELKSCENYFCACALLWHYYPRIWVRVKGTVIMKFCVIGCIFATSSSYRWCAENPIRLVKRLHYWARCLRGVLHTVVSPSHCSNVPSMCGVQHWYLYWHISGSMQVV